MEVDKCRVDDHRWKASDDHGTSIWNLDFPKVCMGGYAGAGTFGGGGTISIPRVTGLPPYKGMTPTMTMEDSAWDYHLDSILKTSEMFSILETARQKVLSFNCRKPCCTENSLPGQVRFLGVTPWDGIGGFSRDAGVPVVTKDGNGFSPPPYDSREYYYAGGTYFWPDGSGNARPCRGGGAASAGGDRAPGEPHAALDYVLPLLLLKDLLAVEQVCRSLKDSVSRDPTLWTTLQVENPLNLKLTDDILLGLADRSQGQLRNLVLIDCPKISDVAVERVVGANPRISRISLLNCIRISGEAVVRMAESLYHGKQTAGMPGLKRLEIRGISGTSREDYAKLEEYLEVDKQGPQKPRFFPSGDGCERAIDIDSCPKCNEPRVVYDCTREECPPSCRACNTCIVRCNECGVCLENVEYEETFNLLNLCATCKARSPKCLQCGKQQTGPVRLTLYNGTFVCPDCATPYTGKAPGQDFYVM